MIKITITGLKELQEAVMKLPSVGVRELGIATEKTVDELWRNSLKEAPVNKQTGGGTLRQSIRKRMISRFKGEIIAFAKYSAAVHEGTSPHIITVVNKKVLANKRTGQIFGKTVRHPGTRPNPFFDRAIEDSIGKIQQFISTALQNIINTLK